MRERERINYKCIKVRMYSPADGYNKTSYLPKKIKNSLETLIIHSPLHINTNKSCHVYNHILILKDHYSFGNIHWYGTMIIYMYKPDLLRSVGKYHHKKYVNAMRQYNTSHVSRM